MTDTKAALAGLALIAEAVTEHFGPRCETQDTDDFPEMKGKKVGRCAICLAWEEYDAFTTLQQERDALTARVEDLEGALRLLALRAESLAFCHRHGNGLSGWHNCINAVDDAISTVRAALSDGRA